MKPQLNVLLSSTKCAINLTEIPAGETYEDRYSGYIDVFRRVAELDEEISVTAIGAPFTWVPLLSYLGAYCVQSREVFPSCVCAALMDTCSAQTPALDRRTFLSVVCSFRPETADALYQCDMIWRTPRCRNASERLAQPEFIITTNGDFHRHEVLKFMSTLDVYDWSQHKKLVIVPCAADKPYPSELHRRILEFMPSDYEMVIATGVLGLVPRPLWEFMPHYDSGIPNEWRLMNRARKVFDEDDFDLIAVYSDYYAYAIDCARHLSTRPTNYAKFRFLFQPVPRQGYEDLLSQDNLDRLRETLT